MNQVTTVPESRLLYNTLATEHEKVSFADPSNPMDYSHHQGAPISVVTV